MKFNLYKKINICLIKPNEYIHSHAFWELGELIFYSLKDLGFEVEIGFNRIDPAGKNIIIGCHLLNPKMASSIPGSTIILNTEQIFTDETPWNQFILEWAKKLEIWDYSEKNIEKFTESGVKNVKHFKIGYQKELARLDGKKEKDVDVLFYGSLNDRRKTIINQLESHGLKVKTLFGVYGKERDEWIARSKIVLNHHFYKSQIFEIVRVFYLLTNSIAVVGEVNASTSIDPMCREGIVAAKYEELAEKCLEIINNESLTEKIKIKALDSISRYPQNIFTKEIIDF